MKIQNRNKVRRAKTIKSKSISTRNKHNGD